MNGHDLTNGDQKKQLKAMRVTKITVEGLFGVFNHEISLNSVERVTIIVGPNGFGKTVILRMIAALARGATSIFEHTPFTEFRLTFEDGTERIIQRQIAEKAEGVRSRATLRFLLRDAKGVTEKLVPTVPENLPRSVLTEIDHLVPGPYQLRTTYWIDDEGQQYSVGDILQMFPLAAEGLPQELRPTTLFWDTLGALKLFFIETNRLGAEPSPVDRSPDEEAMYRRQVAIRERLQRPVPSRVKQYSEDLVQRIRSVLADYAKNSQESDRTFPERLVRFVRDGGTVLAEREILAQMTELEKKRRRLISLGLLDSESGLRDLAEEDIRRAPEALSIYVRDVRQKLNVFDDLAGRIGALMDIVNNRFKYKQLKIDRDQGFRAISDLNEPIQLEDLSSGEQHELVVLYELLFRAPKNALVLVDEPEISLHVAWQSRFLSDLIDILQVTDAYAIVATHSPTIIGSRWDLATELKGPEVLTAAGH